MRKLQLTILFLTFCFLSFSQNKSGTVYLKSGETISISDFAFCECSGEIQTSRKSSTRTPVIRGKYNGQVLSVQDYSNVRKIELKYFSQGPTYGKPIGRGTIILTKINGQTITITEATFESGCHGSSDKYNVQRFCVINPVTDKLSDTQINNRDIKFIVLN